MSLLASAATALASSLPASPLEIPDVAMKPFRSAFSAIEAWLAVPSVDACVLSHVSPAVLAGRDPSK